MDPCGMWVEMLHSFYRMPVRIQVGGRPYKTWIRWYRAPAGAKQLPFPTVFSSDVWSNTFEKHPPGVGEIGHPRVWDRGLNTDGYLGQCFVGEPEWFMTGQLPAEALCGDPPELPVCCKQQPAMPSGDLILESDSQVEPSIQPVTPTGSFILQGASIWGPPYRVLSTGAFRLLPGSHVVLPPYPPHATGAIILGSAPSPMPSPSPSASGGGGFPETDGCDACPDGAARTYVAHVIGVQDLACTQCVSLNADLFFHWAGACGWIGPTLLQCGASTGFTSFDISGAGGQILLTFPLATYQAPRGTWDCLSPLLLTNTFATGDCTWPPTIVVEPAP